MRKLGFFECVDLYDGGGWVAKGWANFDGCDTNNILLLAVDGKIVDEFSASIRRADLIDAGLPNARAFEITLPSFVGDGAQHDIGIFFGDTNNHLESSPKCFTAPRFHGRIERLENLLIEGWAFDAAEPDRPVLLNMEVDGISRKIVLADAMRSDLASAFRNSGRNAFRILLPSEFCDGLSHRLNFRIANTDHMLSHESIEFEFSKDYVPEAFRNTEARIGKLERKRDELTETLLRIPVSDLDNVRSYRRWLTQHMNGWRSYDEDIPKGDFHSPFFTLLLDPSFELPLHMQQAREEAEIICRGPDIDLREAVIQSKGQYILFPGREGAPDPRALSILKHELVKKYPPCLYTDDDVLSNGKYSLPRFKPSWDVDRFLGIDYIGRAVVIRNDVARSVVARGNLIESPEDIIAGVLLSVEESEVERLPLVLFHASAPQVLEQAERRQQRLYNWLKLRDDTVKVRPLGEVLRITRDLPAPDPEVTLIIPTRDRVEFLRPCIDSVLRKTNYRNFKVLIVDNGSTDVEALNYIQSVSRDDRVNVMVVDGPFNFSYLNNKAISQVRSPLVCLLNNDIVVHHGDWLGEMISHAMEPRVGAVGAKLLFPDGLVQHGGVVVGFHGVADNSQRGIGGHQNGYGYGLRVTQRVSAVTAACLVCRREVYEAVGGLDEEALPISFNDVDFCLRLGNCGYHIIWTPFAELFHHESASRRVVADLNLIRREQQEAEEMAKRWGTKYYDDPYYSPNLNRGGVSTHSGFSDI